MKSNASDAKQQPKNSIQFFLPLYPIDYVERYVESKFNNSEEKHKEFIINYYQKNKKATEMLIQNWSDALDKWGTDFQWEFTQEKWNQLSDQEKQDCLRVLLPLTPAAINLVQWEDAKLMQSKENFGRQFQEWLLQGNAALEIDKLYQRNEAAGKEIQSLLLKYRGAKCTPSDKPRYHEKYCEMAKENLGFGKELKLAFLEKLKKEDNRKEFRYLVYQLSSYFGKSVRVSEPGKRSLEDIFSKSLWNWDEAIRALEFVFKEIEKRLVENGWGDFELSIACRHLQSEPPDEKHKESMTTHLQLLEEGYFESLHIARFGYASHHRNPFDIVGTLSGELSSSLSRDFKIENPKSQLELFAKLSKPKILLGRMAAHEIIENRFEHKVAERRQPPPVKQEEKKVTGESYFPTIPRPNVSRKIDENKRKINELIDTLTREFHSSFPMDKNIKLVKIEVLGAILTEEGRLATLVEAKGLNQTYSPPIIWRTAIENVRKKDEKQFLAATQGSYSERTKTLLKDIAPGSTRISEAEITQKLNELRNILIRESRSLFAIDKNLKVSKIQVLQELLAAKTKNPDTSWYRIIADIKAKDKMRFFEATMGVSSARVKNLLEEIAPGSTLVVPVVQQEEKKEEKKEEAKQSAVGARPGTPDIKSPGCGPGA